MYNDSTTDFCSGSEKVTNKICRICHMSEAATSSYFSSSCFDLSDFEKDASPTPYNDSCTPSSSPGEDKDKAEDKDKDKDNKKRSFLVLSSRDDPLIAPCRCSGSMRYVHRSCINEWRITSSRSDSYFRCEQCFALYTFSTKQKWYSSRVRTAIVVAGSTILTMLFVIFVAYVMANFGRLLDELVPPGDDTMVDVKACMWMSGCDCVLLMKSHGREEEKKNETSTHGNVDYYIHVNPYSSSTKSTISEINEAATAAATTGQHPKPSRTLSLFEASTCHVDSYVYSDIEVLNTIMRFLLEEYFYLSMSCCFISIAYFLLVTFNLNMLFNIVFAIWRLQRYHCSLDFVILGIFIVIGLVGVWMEVYAALGLKVESYLKLPILDIQDFAATNNVANVH